jgi:hypothetical protein
LEPLVLSMRFAGHVTGEAPEVDVHGETASVKVEGGDGAGIDVVSYDTRVTFTSETSERRARTRARRPETDVRKGGA